MIKGLTHDTETGSLNSIVKFKGKISTGFAPNEGPNQRNSPAAAGYFRILKEVVQTSRSRSGKEQTVKKWVLNKEIQAKLEEITGSKTPRKIEFICLFQDPDQLWESYLAQYSSTEGLICRSSGEGTVANYLQFNDKGERIWTEREFNGINGCIYKDCPDYKSKICKEFGIMRVFPIIDLSAQPYRFESRSVNTIRGIESQINSLWRLVKAAHMVKCAEAGKQLEFQGLFGAKFALVHRKARSGGRDIYITDIVPSDEFSKSVMNPITRGIKINQKASIASNVKEVAMIGSDIETSQDFIDVPSESMDSDDERDVAVAFDTDAAQQHQEETESDTLDDAAQALVEESGGKVQD